jgi:tetratricopeptide (TPR) repeat protein
VEQKKAFEKALSILRTGDYQAAADMCVTSLERFPGDANLLVLSARANLGLRDFSTAESNVQEAIRLFPDFAQAHETLGDLMLFRGDPRSARTAFETASRLDPSRRHIRDKIKRVREIKKSATRRAASDGIRFEAELAEAQRNEEEGKEQAAEMIYRDILKRDPKHVEAARLLAGVATRQKNFRDAEVLLKEVVKNAPDYVRAWADLAHVQRERDQLADSVVSAKHVLELTPERAESHMVYAGAVGSAGDHARAVESYRAAIEIDPERAGAYTGMAHHQKTIGLHEEAVASYRKSIETKTDNAEAYWSLANLKTFRFEDQEVAAMNALLETDLPDESRAQIHNALGLEMESRQEYERAFSHFVACNEARRPLERYDPVDTEDMYGRLIELFSKDFLSANAGVEAAATTPILVVGLPRSGSTLIEQILASHSQVEGTHELPDLSRSIKVVRQKQKGRTRFPEVLEDLALDDWRHIGEEYLRRTEQHRQGSPYFVDKNPNNFIYTGVLHLALPNAKIINARRHPLDSCLGSFKQLFASGQPFTYDMTEISEYYLQYRRLMDHWHEVSPGYVLDVQYEAVVADLENQVRRILEFCGLPFEDACLRFHETERAVKTASSEQVRRPIYSSSVNLWRNYEPHLDEMVHILKPLLEPLPAKDRPLTLGGDPDAVTPND